MFFMKIYSKSYFELICYKLNSNFEIRNLDIHCLRFNVISILTFSNLNILAGSDASLYTC